MYLVVGSDLPYTEEDFAWARRRPAPDRVPLPEPGDEVLYRQDEMGPMFHAEVIGAPSLEDLSDPNVWRWQRDPVEGRRVLALGVDPWPLVPLRVYFPNRPPQLGRAQEARLPGAAGWLPLDWEQRQARLVRFHGRRW